MPTVDATARSLTVDLTPNEANAVVFTILHKTIAAGELLGHCRLSTVPGDLVDASQECDRISRLSGIATQLKWRAHWGPLGGEPPAITAPEPVMLELSAALHAEIDDDCDWDEVKDLAFESAARKIARAYAEAA